MEEDLPDRLYRVFDNSSVSKYSKIYGFRAQDDAFPLEAAETAHHMWEPVRRHLDWSNRYPTPFVSTWESSQKAWKTAKRREERGCQNVKIAVIEVDILKENDVWFEKSIDIVEKFDVYLPERTRRYLSSVEYLCLHSIPRKAIIRVMDWEDFEEYCESEGGRYAKIYRNSRLWRC